MKVVEIGDGPGVILLPVPSRVLKELGWEDGDEVSFDLPMVHRDVLHVMRKEVQDV